MCFIGKKHLDSAKAMQIWLSLKTLQKTSGFGRCISKMNDIYFISAIKRIPSRITGLNMVYSTSIVIKVISVYN